jgi:hypothetical protein
MFLQKLVIEAAWRLHVLKEKPQKTPLNYQVTLVYASETRLVLGT